jgi:hypothetical protein
MSPLVVGSIGVGLLLVAFILNLLRVISEQGRIYLLMNVVGAALACWYAWQDRMIPFVILEAVWGLTALVRMFVTATKNPRTAGG